DRLGPGTRVANALPVRPPPKAKTLLPTGSRQHDGIQARRGARRGSLRHAKLVRDQPKSLSGASYARRAARRRVGKAVQGGQGRTQARQLSAELEQMALQVSPESAS